MTETMQNKTVDMGALLIRPAINISALTPEQRTTLGYQLENGTGMLEQDYELARLTYLSAAADGAALAMNNLGWLYHNGMGVEADEDKARLYFEQAADKGCTVAMINLGNLDEDAGDYEEAYKWYRMAYVLGDIRGQFNYANMYYWGWYVPQDYEFAFRLFYENAHDWNDAEACWGAGHMLQEGLGIDKDEEAAANWFARGEALGDAYCATELGRCYCLGLGVEKNDELGLKYYLEGAERGDSLAYANIGYAYEIGQGVAKSEHLALSYYEKGAELGEEHCLEAVERLRPSGQSDDEIFLGHIGGIGKDLQRVAGTIENPFLDIYDEMENEPLENAIAQFYSNHCRETYEAVITALAQRVREGGEVMCPVESRIGENGEPQVHPLAVQSTDGKRWMAVYTNMQLAAERAGEQYLARISMRGALRISLDYPDIEGVAINPCDESFNLTHEEVRNFLENV